MCFYERPMKTLSCDAWNLETARPVISRKTRLLMPFSGRLLPLPHFIQSASPQYLLLFSIFTIEVICMIMKNRAPLIDHGEQLILPKMIASQQLRSNSVFGRFSKDSHYP